jgi:hypothetical protein
MELPAQEQGHARGQDGRDSEPVRHTAIRDHAPHKAPHVIAGRQVGDERVVGGRGARGHFVEQAECEVRTAVVPEVEEEERVSEYGVGVEKAEAESEGVEGIRTGGEGGSEGREGEGIRATALEEQASEEVEREVRVGGVGGGGERREEGIEDR